MGRLIAVFSALIPRFRRDKMRKSKKNRRENSKKSSIGKVENRKYRIFVFHLNQMEK